MDYIKYIRNMVGHQKIIMNAAACIIVNEHNHVLLQLRGDDGFWGLPGGIMELGETLEDTCKREVYEETGLTINNFTLLGPYYNPNKVWPGGDQAHIICHVYVANHVTGSLMIDQIETLDLQYFSYLDLPDIHAIDHLQAIHDYYRTK